jgi:hypothetical protein
MMIEHVQNRHLIGPLQQLDFLLAQNERRRLRCALVGGIGKGHAGLRDFALPSHLFGGGGLQDRVVVIADQLAAIAGAVGAMHQIDQRAGTRRRRFPPGHACPDAGKSGAGWFLGLAGQVSVAAEATAASKRPTGCLARNIEIPTRSGGDYIPRFAGLLCA